MFYYKISDLCYWLCDVIINMNFINFIIFSVGLIIIIKLFWSSLLSWFVHHYYIYFYWNEGLSSNQHTAFLGIFYQHTSFPQAPGTMEKMDNILKGIRAGKSFENLKAIRGGASLPCNQANGSSRDVISKKSDEELFENNDENHGWI